MPKNIKGTSSLAGKNVQNSESIGNLTADTIRANTVVATNATITNLTNTELQTATSNIATNTSNISTNTGNISTNTGNIATNTSDISTLQTSKQDVITAGTGLSFTGDTLNAEVTQAELDAKQDIITSSTSISCADINCNTNPISGVTVLNCRSIELHNSGNNLSFLDFGEGDYRFRQLYNQNSNTFTFSIDDATGENPQNKMNITRTEVNILNAVLDLNSNDITNVANLNGITSTEISYLDGVSSNIQTQLDAKLDTLTAGNGIDIVGSTISVDEAELTTKQDVITGSTNLTCNDLDANFITCNDINLQTGDLRNVGDGAFSTITLNGSDLQNKIDDKADLFGVLLPIELDATAIPNPALKLNYSTTYFQLTGSNLDLTGTLPNDITGIRDFGSSSNIRFYVDGDTTGSANYTLNLKADGDADFNGGSLLNVEGIESSNFPTTAVLRMMSFNSPNTNSTNTGNYGNDSYLNSFGTGVGEFSEIEIGSTFLSLNVSNVFQMDEAGTYKITVSAHGDNTSINDRVVLGFYVSINDNTTQWHEYADSFGMIYLRDDNFGQGGSCSFTSIRSLALNDTVRIKTKAGRGNNNWNETIDDGLVDVWCSVTFEKLF